MTRDERTGGNGVLCHIGTFLGNFVFDSVNMAFRDDDSVLDKIYIQSKYVRIFMGKFNFLNNI